MADEKLLKDFEDAVLNVNEVKAFLDRLYYSDELGNFFNRPALSFMSTAADFLVTNLKALKVKAQTR